MKITCWLALTFLVATRLLEASAQVNGTVGYNKQVTIFNQITCGSYYTTTFTCEHLIGPNDHLILTDGFESGGSCWHSYIVYSNLWFPVLSNGWVMTSPGGEQLDKVFDGAVIEIPIGIGDLVIDASTIFPGGAVNVQWKINGSQVGVGATLNVGSIAAGVWSVQILNGDGQSITFTIERGDVKIVPADGVAGTVGDRVPAAQGASTSKHFVSPKKSTAIADEHVRLRAKGASPRIFDKYYQWDGGVALPAPYETNRRGVDRAAANESLVRIIRQGNNSEIDRIKTWIVWAVGNIGSLGTTQLVPHSGTTIDNTSTTSMVYEFTLVAPRKFIFTIAPASIITSADRPELGGENTLNPPGFNDIVGNPLSLGANFRWDVSRRLRCEIYNPNLIPRGKFSSGFGTLYDTQPAVNATPVSFPSDDPVVGNDDAATGDENNNPYQTYSGTHLAHGVGEISSFDPPSCWRPKAGSSNGYNYEQRLIFQEFARAQLGSKWYVISEGLQWKHNMKVVYSGSQGQWIDNGSVSGAGN